ncbi:hypothetical protein ACFX1Z_038625 [Malus domestica]
MSNHPRVTLHFTLPDLPDLPDLPACPRPCSFALATKYPSTPLLLAFWFLLFDVLSLTSLSTVDRKAARNWDLSLHLSFN